MKKKTQPENVKISIIYADFLNVFQEALGMASDMPRKIRMTIDSTFQELSLNAFRNLVALKTNRVPKKEVVENMIDCIVSFQVFFETAIKLRAVAEARCGKFIELSEFVLKKLRLHGKDL